MSNYNDRDKGIKFLLSIIYPLGAFFYSWKNLKARSTYWVFFLFFIVYGLCFTAAFEAADSYRYVEDLRAFSMNARGNFQSVTQEFFSKDSEIKDIFVYALYYLTDILSGGNYRVFFALVAIIFGFFFLRSFKFITDDEAFKNTPFFILLALIFTLSNPIFNINGVRFWTAAWIAVYATFQVLINKKRLYILLLAVLPLVHGSYYVFIVFFAAAYLARHFYKILPYLFFISFFFTDIALQIIPDISGYLPPFLQNMIWSYTESSEALARMSGEEAAQEALYARILMAIPRYYHVLLIYLLVRCRPHFKDETSKEFLGFVLGYGALVNISSMIPSMIRFWYLLIPFYVYLWVHNSHMMEKYKSVIYWYPLVALYPTWRLIRNMYYTTDPVLYFSNTIHIVFRALMSG